MNNLKGSTLSAGTSGDDKHYSEVADYVSQLESQTDRLNAIMQNLRSRLDAVMIQNNPVDGSKAGLAAVGPSSKLGQQLANVLHANANTCDELNDLINRLSL